MEKALLKDRLKEAMILRNLKQVDLMERGNFDKGQLSSWLSGKYKPRQINIDKLAEILNIDEAWLMGYDVPMKRKSDEEKVVGKTQSTELTTKDTRDIKKDLDRIIEQLTSQEYGPAAYDGEELSPEAAELFRDELEIALRRLKLINKEKYNPHKNKK